MQFKTPQAQAAYGEVCAEYGRAVDEYQRAVEALVALRPEAVVEIRMDAAEHVAQLRTSGIEAAIRLANEVDMQWASLAGHLTIVAQH